MTGASSVQNPLVDGERGDLGADAEVGDALVGRPAAVG
jgi:hypothetical protein